MLPIPFISSFLVLTASAANCPYRLPYIDGLVIARAVEEINTFLGSLATLSPLRASSPFPLSLLLFLLLLLFPHPSLLSYPLLMFHSLLIASDDGRTDGRTYGRTDPLIEMRGCI